MSGTDPQLGDEDLAPGVMGRRDGVRNAVGGYLLGLVLAAALTCASFYIGLGHFIWSPAVPIALVALAIAQIGVHLVFFIHLSSAPDNTNNVIALAFGVLIVFLILAGSIWIIGHLNQNMLPMDQIMKMQR